MQYHKLHLLLLLLFFFLFSFRDLKLRVTGVAEQGSQRWWSSSLYSLDLCSAKGKRNDWQVSPEDLSERENKTMKDAWRGFSELFGGFYESGSSEAEFWGKDYVVTSVWRNQNLKNVASTQNAAFFSNSVLFFPQSALNSYFHWILGFLETHNSSSSSS